MKCWKFFWKAQRTNQIVNLYRVETQGKLNIHKVGGQFA